MPPQGAGRAVEVADDRKGVPPFDRNQVHLHIAIVRQIVEQAFGHAEQLAGGFDRPDAGDLGPVMEIVGFVHPRHWHHLAIGIEKVKSPALGNVGDPDLALRLLGQRRRRGVGQFPTGDRCRRGQHRFFAWCCGDEQRFARQAGILGGEDHRLFQMVFATVQQDGVGLAWMRCLGGANGIAGLLQRRERFGGGAGVGVAAGGRNVKLGGACVGRKGSEEKSGGGFKHGCNSFFW